MGYPLLMNKNALFFLFLSVFALGALNLGSIRRTEDPIRDTQTNPILYEQKKEEEKDGKKGPLMYHVKYNPRESFFIDPPYETAQKDAAKGFLEDEIAASPETADWWEEQPADPGTVSSEEAVPASAPEPLFEEEKSQDLANEEPATSGTEVEGAASGKGDDYWW